MTRPVQVHRAPFSPAFARQYLAGLNRSFPGWGDQARFDWCFAREGDPCAADLLIIEQSGVAVAGMAVPYREVTIGGARELVGIMCGAWTDPAVRRGGSFTTLLEAVGEVARSSGASMLTGFMRGIRPSMSVLNRYCDMVGDAGFVSIAGGGANGSLRADFLSGGVPIGLEQARDSLVSGRIALGMAGYAYEPGQWWRQVIEPNGHVAARQFPDGMIAVFTQTSRGSRILDHLPMDPAALLENFSGLAQEFGNCTFHTCDARVLADAALLGAEIAPAYTFFKRLGATRWSRETRWFFTDGERM